ncbi:MAG TPA: MarR family transcriptional regulator [Mycobacteriales bacterium]|nr:MarR family transcriptional regulator [Mycobacteriales bacterium]
MSLIVRPLDGITEPDADSDLERLAAALVGSIRLVRRLVPADGISLTGLSTLSALDRAGASRVGVLADSEHLTQPAMTQLVSRLAAQGLVERHPDPGDGRVVLVTLTATGRQLLASRKTARARALAGRMRMLDDGERAALATALPALEHLLALEQPTA